MPYRTASAPSDRSPRKIHYGPFNRGWARVAGTLVVTAAAIFVGSLGDFAGNGNASLRCDRRAATCVLDNEYIVLGREEHHRFAIDDVREVTRYSEFREYDIGIYVGAEKFVMHRGSQEDLEQIHTFFFDRQEQEKLDVSIWPSLIILGEFAVVAGLCLVVLFGLFRRPGFIEIVVHNEVIEVKQRWYGISIGTRIVSLDSVSEIRVKYADKSTFMQNERPAGTIFLVAQDLQRPLTMTPMFGTDVHDRTAHELARAIGCKVTA